MNPILFRTGGVQCLSREGGLDAGRCQDRERSGLSRIDGRHGSLSCDAGRAAVEVLVEEHVTDDGDRQSTCGVEDSGQSLRGVLTVRTDCY